MISSFQRLMTLLMISFAFILAASSCKKSSSNGNNNNNDTAGTIAASVNGTAWANSFPLNGTFSIGTATFQILGEQLKGGDTTGLGVIFLSQVMVNQTVSSDSGWCDVEYADAQTQARYDGGHQAGHSILTITSYDPTNEKIAGTFSGVLYNITGGNDSLLVTNGSFSSTYTNQ